MVYRGDFNEIKTGSEKQGGRQRSEGSFNFFNQFITNMCMAEVRYIGRTWTWANNRVGEGFIQERLDRFFGSAEWLLHFDKAEVKHVLRQASDHSLLVWTLNRKAKRQNPDLFLNPGGLDNQKQKA